MQYHQHSCVWTLHRGACQQGSRSPWAKAVVHHLPVTFDYAASQRQRDTCMCFTHHTLLCCTVVLSRKCLNSRALCAFILLAAICVAYVLVQLLTAAHMYAYVIAHAPAKGPARGLYCTVVALNLCRCLCGVSYVDVLANLLVCFILVLPGACFTVSKIAACIATSAVWCVCPKDCCFICARKTGVCEVLMQSHTWQGLGRTGADGTVAFAWWEQHPAPATGATVLMVAICRGLQFVLQGC
jgi:hypothetical protein